MAAPDTTSESSVEGCLRQSEAHSQPARIEGRAGTVSAPPTGSRKRTVSFSSEIRVREFQVAESDEEAPEAQGSGVSRRSGEQLQPTVAEGPVTKHKRRGSRSELKPGEFPSIRSLTGMLY